jgi:hypothetical protein
MNTNVNEAVTTWNDEHTAATAELVTLEATLKADYNKYIGSLAAYVARVKTANDVRNGFIRQFEIEDVSNGTNKGNFSKTIQFISNAKSSIENEAAKYLLDNDRCYRATPVVVIVDACDANRLLERKVD